MAPVSVTLGGISIPQSSIGGIGIRRGRSDELARINPGTANVLINLDDNHGDPIGGSEITGQLGTIALRNPVSGGMSTIYEGYVDEVKPIPDNSRVVTRLEVELIDALDRFNGVELAPSLDASPPFGYEVPPGFAGQVFYEDSGQVKFRIEKALLEAGWPTDKQAIFTGNVSLQETFYSARTSLMEVINDAAEAEFPDLGVFFVTKDGVVRFKGRLARFNADDPQYDVVHFPVGMSSGGAAQLRDITLNKTRPYIINQALVTPKGVREDKVPELVVIDQGSIDAFGPYAWSAENLLLETGFLGNPNRNAVEECLLMAQWKVDNYKSPRLRVESVVFKSLRPSDYRAGETWNLICEVDLSHLIDLNVTAEGVAIDEGFFVEGISYEIRPLVPEYAAVTLTLELSPQAYWSSNPF